MSDKLTKNQCAALAFTHFVGWMPRGIHNKTTWAIRDYLHMGGDGSPEFYVLNDGALPLVETTKVARAVTRLEAYGFVWPECTLDRYCRRPRGRRNLRMIRHADATEASIDWKSGDTFLKRPDDETTGYVGGVYWPLKAAQPVKCPEAVDAPPETLNERVATLFSEIRRHCERRGLRLDSDVVWDLGDEVLQRALTIGWVDIVEPKLSSDTVPYPRLTFRGWQVWAAAKKRAHTAFMEGA